MQQITIRGLQPEVEKKIRQIASDKHLSINQVIKDIIHKEFGVDNPKPRAATLMALSGGWNPDEAAEFNNAIKSCEQIDEEMWK